MQSRPDHRMTLSTLAATFACLIAVAAAAAPAEAALTVITTGSFSNVANFNVGFPPHFGDPDGPYTEDGATFFVDDSDSDSDSFGVIFALGMTDPDDNVLNVHFNGDDVDRFLFTNTSGGDLTIAGVVAYSDTASTSALDSFTGPTTVADGAMWGLEGATFKSLNIEFTFSASSPVSIDDFQFNIGSSETVVPEPMTAGLAMLGLLGLGATSLVRRRR